jgi:hypothetical protein
LRVQLEVGIERVAQRSAWDCHLRRLNVRRRHVGGMIVLWRGRQVGRCSICGQTRTRVM